VDQKNQPSDRRNPSTNEIEEIKSRLDRGDQRFQELEANLRENTEATRQIAENTAGIVRLTTELEAGTRFLCRCALAVRFILKDVVEPYWKPSLLVFVVVYYITHDHQFPGWVDSAFKALAG
jgi:hypothetical protein